MKKKTLTKTVIGVIVIGAGVGYFMYHAMQSSWTYYYSVDEFSDVRAMAKDYSLRIAGKVKPGSVQRDVGNMQLRFVLAGARNELPIHYSGSIPDSFGEDREVVVQGRLDTQGVFRADTLLTRCESKYKAKLE